MSRKPTLSRLISHSACYIWTNLLLTDTDECNNKRRCGDVAVCNNTLGSFHCICPKGFDYEEGKCYGKCNTLVHTKQWRENSTNYYNYIKSFGQALIKILNTLLYELSVVTSWFESISQHRKTVRVDTKYKEIHRSGQEPVMQEHLKAKFWEWRLYHGAQNWICRLSVLLSFQPIARTYYFKVITVAKALSNLSV